MINRQIDVMIGDRSYPIYAGSNMVSSFAPICREHSSSDSIVIITDRNVASYHLQPLLRNLLHHKFRPITITIPAGEMQKNLRRAEAIFTELLEKRIPRNAAVIALGGGVIGDLGGFVAATYQRGIKLVQIPTTLLAQADSSIGGKVGVNHRLGKNMIGAFYQPIYVWMDADYLKTLPLREIICGIGEAIKYGIICDAGLFNFFELHLEEILHLDTEAIMYVQLQCAAIKADIVSRDEKESGIRIILNCGHTIGHGLESAGGYRLLRHGEAVLLGLIAESFIAREMKLLDEGSFDRILSLICRVPVKAKISSLRIPEIINAMGRDKKRVENTLRFILPTKVGEAKIVENVDPKLIQSAVKKILNLR